MPFTTTDAELIALEHYALSITAAHLPGELDANFLLTTSDRAKYILKIAHPSRSLELLDLENQIMAHLEGKQTPCVLPSQTGDMITTLAGGAFVRLLTYLPGEVFAHVSHTSEILLNLGKYLGQLDHALGNFTHPAMKRELLWDLTRAGEMIRKYEEDLSGNRALLSRFLHRFERHNAPQLPSLPWQVIHNDANDYNVLVENDQISGLLDFGDALYNPRICELAIGIAYAILNKEDPLTTATLITEGYHATNPLTKDEVAVLWDLIGARLAVSVAVSSHRAIAEPDNEYLQISAAPAWKTLFKLAEIDPDAAHTVLRQATGFDR